jgi:hypothetical protein
MKLKMKTDFKFWLNIFTIAALCFLVFISWDQIVDAFRELDGLNTWALLLMIPIQGISYYAVARFYKTFFDTHGTRIRLREFYKISLELNFVNHVFPSGGVSGFSYLSIRLKQLGIPTAKSTLAQLLRFCLTFVSFLVLLLFAVFALSLSASAGGLIILISSSIVLATIFGTAVGVYIISSPRRIKSFVSWLPKAVNFIAKIFKRDKKTSIINIAKVESTLDDLHDDYVELRKDMNLVYTLLKWTLLVNFSEVLTVYMVYVAFGELINPGALIIAYAVANFAGLVAILPGGVGIYEGLMTATLAAAGVPKALALSATVIYRVLSIIFFIPIGYYFYHKALISRGNKQNSEDTNATVT